MSCPSRPDRQDANTIGRSLVRARWFGKVTRYKNRPARREASASVTGRLGCVVCQPNPAVFASRPAPCRMIATFPAADILLHYPVARLRKPGLTICFSVIRKQKLVRKENICGDSAANLLQ